jgi:colanic acid biosynthesis protein WcaH
MNPAWLEPDIFRTVVRHAPLVAIDLILRDPAGAALLGYRTNRPAMHFWFVPGGRIGKDERLADAFARILEVETGLKHLYDQTRLLGAYEHLYDDNRFGEPGYGTHYVTLGMELKLAARPAIRIDDQHTQIAWMLPDELLSRADVHENTKAYFR